MKNLRIYFIGTAGSGKSTLTGAFLEWMQRQGYDAIALNLDPGAEALPYDPDIDIRHWLNLSTVMAEYSLGPNGGQIACADMLALKIPEVREELDKITTDYVLIDTPGQMELFTFRHASTKIISQFGRSQALIVLLYDPFIALTPIGFISQILLGATVQYRFYLPSVFVLSKIDMIEPQDLNKILNWANNPNMLADAIEVESGGNMHAYLHAELLQILDELGVYRELIPCSAYNMTGMEDIYNQIQQYFFGGEDLERR